MQNKFSYPVTKKRAWGTATPTIIGLTPCPNNSMALAIHVGTLYQPLINGLTPCPTIQWHTRAIHVGTLYQPYTLPNNSMAHTTIHVGTPYPTIIGLTPCRKQLIGTWPYMWVRNIKYIHIIVIHVEYLYNEYNHR